MTLSIVSDLQHYDSQLAEVDKMLEQMYKMLGCTLTTIPGVNVITAVKILAIQMVQLSSKGTPRNPVVLSPFTIFVEQKVIDFHLADGREFEEKDDEGSRVEHGRQVGTAVVLSCRRYYSCSSTFS